MDGAKKKKNLLRKFKLLIVIKDQIKMKLIGNLNN